MKTEKANEYAGPHPLSSASKSNNHPAKYIKNCKWTRVHVFLPTLKSFSADTTPEDTGRDSVTRVTDTE